jgi:hypothetical protein
MSRLSRSNRILGKYKLGGGERGGGGGRGGGARTRRSRPSKPIDKGISKTASKATRTTQKKSTDPPVHLITPGPAHPPTDFFF